MTMLVLLSLRPPIRTMVAHTSLIKISGHRLPAVQVTSGFDGMNSPIPRRVKKACMQ